MGTDKRERQKAGRQAKILEETAAAKRQRTFRTARNFGIAVVIILGGAFLYSTLSGDDDEPDTATEDESTTTSTSVPETTTTTYSNPEVAAAIQERGKPDPAPPPTDTPKDAVEVTTLVEGEGEGAKAGDTITVEYVGKLPDGEVFDYSWENHAPFPLVLGSGEVIAGWDEGLVGVKLGERRRIVIGSDKAYGAEGREGIPPNSPLVFEVDIIDLAPAG